LIVTEEHIAKDYKEMQSIKKHNVQKESNNKEKEKGQDFGDDFK